MGSTADTAKAMRQQLKRELGANSKQISVRIKEYSLGASITVTIKDARFCLADVQRVASEFQDVARCEITGEILNGGNTYVSVSYDYNLVSALQRAIFAALEVCEHNGGLYVEIAGLRCCLLTGTRYDYCVVVGEERERPYGRESAARTIAFAILGRRTDRAATAVWLDSVMDRGGDVGAIQSAFVNAA